MVATANREEILQVIRRLESEAEQLESSHRVKMSELFNRISAAAQEAAKMMVVNGGAKPQTTTTAEPKKRRGRPPGSGKKNAQKPPKAESKSKSKNYSNQKTLKETFWEVLSRDPKEWKKVIADLPENATGLKVSEVKQIIDSEGVWVSSSDNIRSMLQTLVYNLGKEGKIQRGDDRRYHIVPGQSL